MAYSYDAQGRVTDMTPGTSSPNTYGFDASGNLTTLPSGGSGGYDNADELTSSVLSGSTTSYTYDADGQRTQESFGGTTTVSASYNGAGELTSYSDAAADMTNASYDGSGLRQSESSTPTGGSAVAENFTWDVRGSVPRLLMDSDNAYIDVDGAPIEQVSLATGDVTYLVSDLLGSVRGAVSGSGALLASTAYDAWGNPETSGGLTADTPLGFAGAYTDASGVSYMINRYYDPESGQFITVDPRVDETRAAYAYAADDPIKTKDPSGLCAGQSSAVPIPGGPGGIGIGIGVGIGGKSSSNEQKYAEDERVRIITHDIIAGEMASRPGKFQAVAWGVIQAAGAEETAAQISVLDTGFLDFFLHWYPYDTTEVNTETVLPAPPANPWISSLLVGYAKYPDGDIVENSSIIEFNYLTGDRRTLKEPKLPSS